MEWGENISTLLKVKERTGKTPQALLDKPDLPFYYEEIVTHFHVLSRSRQYYSDIIPQPKGGFRTARRPNPIDILAILGYNDRIYGILPAEDFIEIIQELDRLYLTRAFSRKD